MKKILILAAIVVFSGLSFPCQFAHAVYDPRPNAQDEESLDDIKAKVRQEVREEMGSKKAPLPPNPASAKDTTQTKKKLVKQKSAQTKNAIAIPVPFDIPSDIASRMAFIIMFFAIVPAALARMKGRSFIAWWVLGSLFFIFVLPIAIFMKTKKRAEPHAVKPPPPKAPEPEVKVERSWDKPSKAEAPVTPEPAGSEDSAIEVYAKIENLAKLKDKGVITEEEFKAKKNELLARI